MRNPSRRQAPPPPPPRGRGGAPARSATQAGLTRRQLSRRQRELRLRRYILISLAAVLALVLAIPAFGYWRENYYRASVPVATIDGQPIATETYAKMLGFQQANLDSQVQQLTNLAAQVSSQSGGQNPFQTQINRLRQERSMLDSTALDRMIEDRLIAREVAQRGIDMTADDIEAAIQKEFGVPTPTPVAEGQPTPEPVPVDPASALSRMRQFLDQSGLLSETEFRDLVVAPQLRRDRLADELGREVATTAPQVHARHILVGTEEEARAALERIRGGQKFEDVAKDVSTDTSNKDKGGDLGWFGKAAMVAEFETAAFGLPVGQVSEPVKTQFGFHLIEVLEKNDARPLDESAIRGARLQKLTEWLTSHRELGSGEGRLVYALTPDKIDWAHSYIERRFRQAARR